MSARYALYFVPRPTSALAQFGSRAIGYDIWTGDVVPVSDLDAYRRSGEALTQEPRRYGFHATLKAPFRLKSGEHEAALEARAAAFANARSAVSVGRLRVMCLSNFIALVPQAPPMALAPLAADCVTRFDDLRAALTERDRARRLATGLTQRQTHYLETWGYPYVLEEFRFHMTLTSAIDAAMRQELEPHLAALWAAVDTPVVIDGLTLVVQTAPDEPFRVKGHFPFRPADAP